MKKSFEKTFSIMLGVGLLLIAGLLILFSASAMRKISDKTAHSSHRIVSDVSAKFNKIVLQSAETILVDKAKSQAHFVESRINVAMDTARTISQLMAGLKAKGASASGINRDRIIMLLKGAIADNKGFMGIYTCWEPDRFDGNAYAYENLEGHDKTGRFIPYWFRDAFEDLSLHPLTHYTSSEKDSNGVRLGEYYLAPRERGEECLIDPFIKKINNEEIWCTSLVSPIIVDRVFYGVAGVDLRLKNIQLLAETVADDLYNGSGQVLFISNNGTVVADSKNPDHIGQPMNRFRPDTWDLQSQYMYSTRQITEIVDGSISVFFPLKIGRVTTPWMVNILLPEEVVIKQARQVTEKMKNELKNVTALSKKESDRSIRKQLLVGGCVSLVVLVMIIFLVRKEMQMMRHAEQAVTESEKKYRNLFESSMDAILLLDPENGYLDCNPAALEMFDIPSKNQLFELTPDDLSPRYQPDGKMSSEKAKLIITKAMADGSIIFEWTHKRLDGVEFFASVLATRVNIGGRTMIQGTIRDISEYKHTQEMMIQSEKMLSVGGLAAGMAHEINNPLAGMIQNASVISNRLTNLEMDANQKAAAEIGIHMDDIKAFIEKREIGRMITAVNESGRRMAAIVNNMLSFARKSDAQVSTHVLSKLLDKTLELAATDFDLKKHYDFKKIKIIKEYGANVPAVPCEGAKIQQVFLNILKNGAQAMQEANIEKPMFIIRTHFEEYRQMVCMEIEDNGPGMSEKTRRRVFEPFYTTKAAGVGTGLGLSVSYFIITENHGGELSVESSLDSGAKFMIRLPLEGKNEAV